MRHIPGLEWLPSGQAVLSGPLLEAFRLLDLRLARWARDAGAREYRVPLFLPARELERLGYFRSFPQQATFPAALDEDPASLRAFGAEPLDEDGAVRLDRVAPVYEALAPAACFHFYVLLQGRELAAAESLTTVATCARREAYYRPLQRQSNFTLRELARIGSPEEVGVFLEVMRERAQGLIEALDLPVEWREGADPLLDSAGAPPHSSPPAGAVKTEMVYGGELALGSLNFHGDFFGRALEIGRGGRPASSGCIAFGLERWLYALLTRHGPDPRAWPAAVVEAP